jgi:hypothetical protein
MKKTKELGFLIIASKLGKIKDILRHKKTALLYGPKDINSLYSFFKSMISNPQLRLKLAINA